MKSRTIDPRYDEALSQWQNHQWKRWRVPIHNLKEVDATLQWKQIATCLQHNQRVALNSLLAFSRRQEYFQQSYSFQCCDDVHRAIAITAYER